MYNFYPGPSKIYPVVSDFAKEAFENGILERNHRSEPFMHLLEQCIELLKNHLNVPEGYKVFFVSSATEAWEICAQSLFDTEAVRFYYTGAFGHKWMRYSERLRNHVSGLKVELNSEIVLDALFQGDVCLVANETSNGTQVNINNIGEREGLVFVDAVSSLGGVEYTISNADVWISSSQKCFGLPSGMGIMVVSPKALARAKAVGDFKHYNSLLFIEENFDNFQTPYTPNILLVYLFKSMLEHLPNIKTVSDELVLRAEKLYAYFDSSKNFTPIVTNKEVRSNTILTLSTPDLKSLHKYLNANRITLGKGYGEWKDTTFRIANFPAIENAEYDYLLEILSNFVPQK